MSWLEDSNPGEFLEALDDQGELVGYIRRREAEDLGLRFRTIEIPHRYLDDPFVRYHVQMAYERGLLTRGQDLNIIQVILLTSHLVKRAEQDEKLRVRQFEESMLATVPEWVREYFARKQKQVEEEEFIDSADVEERVPQSIEEFLQHIKAFSADDEEGSSKEQEDNLGWLSSLLSDAELDEMPDE